MRALTFIDCETTGPDEAHTALGDARRPRDVWDAIAGGAS